METPLSPPPRVLIVDRDVRAGHLLEASLRGAGCDALFIDNVRAALARAADDTVDVVILDEQIAVAGSALQTLQKCPSGTVAIITSSFGSVEGAVAAMRDGAQHYASKPFSDEEMALAVRKATESRRLRNENARLRSELGAKTSFGSLVVRDPKMKQICALAETVAQTRATILLLGESGCGKSLLARAIHQHSPRAAKPFIEVNCGALPENLLESELFGHAKGAFTGAVRERAGRFEAANGGSIFLDEIGTATPSLQIRLLRVLQDRVVERVGEHKSRPVDVRVILATHHDLVAAVANGTFREDLYYRIHVVSIDVPPLRERPIDIPELARHFLKSASESLGRPVSELSKNAMETLLAHPWPGNVRELQNAMERAVAVGRGEIVEINDLPPEIHQRSKTSTDDAGIAGFVDRAAHAIDDVPLGSLEGMLAICEKRFLQRALVAAGENRTKAARLLGLHRATLYQRMHRLGMDPQSPHESKLS
ncbi:MAG: sigma-54-dependent Fis family transcriptional regulator [Planctomycetes bacterium]|nr:sigma-54-dependent Fis family transcriptional regulator [Planctomycetota bacterium]